MSQARSAAGLPPEAYAAALAGLPHLTPSRLRRLLSDRDPAETWSQVRAGRALEALAGEGRAQLDRCPGSDASARTGSTGLTYLDATDEPDRFPDLAAPARGGHPTSRWTPESLARAWRAHAQRTDPGEVWAAYKAGGIGVSMRGGDEYPLALSADPEAPPVLFWLGALSGLDHPTVALVGTRACTHYGEEVAAELGAGLARAGISVVSGLALGIDGAAHRGALARGGAPPLGIVGSGLDVVYPLRHARLWRQVAAVGGLISESPLGAGAEAWRFPWRNRLIAGLSEVIVVVESHRAGGALLTVEAAIRRGVPVLAVPGSIRSPASAGTNALIADGCPPVTDVDDVLVALGLTRSGPQMDRATQEVRPGRSPDPGSPESPCALVWSALDEEPTPTDLILRRTGLTLGKAAAALDQLEETGWARAGDGWWERVSGTPA